MSNLAGITNNNVRQAIGTRAFAKAGIAIHGTNTENVLTATAVPHCVKGIMQTSLAADAEVDLSASDIVDARGNALSAVKTMPALAAGDDPVTKVYILAAIGTAQYIIEPEVVIAAGQDNVIENMRCPDGYCPVATIKVVQTPTPTVGVALFTLGTTALTGVTGQVVSYADISVLPATSDEV